MVTKKMKQLLVINRDRNNIERHCSRTFGNDHFESETSIAHQNYPFILK